MSAPDLKEADAGKPKENGSQRGSQESSSSTRVDGEKGGTNASTNGRPTTHENDIVDLEKSASDPSEGQEQLKTSAVEPAPANPLSPPQPPPIPNGGIQAWMQVFGSFFLFFNTWGLINAYGAFQTFYQVDLLPNTSPSNIAWVGSVQSFLILFVGVITGPLYDAGHFNLLLRVGGFCLVLGLMMTSLCTELWQLVLAQGFLTGIGGGCLFLPSIAVLPQWFSTRKSLAVGIASSGSSTGGIIYPIVFHNLQPHIGFPWATRVVAFIALGTVIIPICVMKVRVFPQGKRKLVQLQAFTEPAFTMNIVAAFFGYIGFFGPFFYIEAYSIAQGKADNQTVAFYLLPIILAGSFFGRILPNLISDRTGPFWVLIPATIISGALALCWIAIKSTPGLIAFCVLFGFTTGGLVSLTPLTVVVITKDFRDLGTRLGMFLAFGALAVLVGAPSLGAILDGTHSYLGVQLFTGICLVVGGFCFIPTKLLADRARRQWAEEKAGGTGPPAAK